MILQATLWISIVVWLLIPIRQRLSRYFYYFLILALSDPIVYAFRKMGVNHYIIIYLLLGEILFLSIFSFQEIKRYIIFFAVIFIIPNLIYFFYPGDLVAELLLVIIHTCILLRFLYFFILRINAEHIFYVFVTVLILYETTIITKFINVLTNFTDAYIYFIITTIFEILIGLFFRPFKEDNPRLLLQLK